MFSGGKNSYWLLDEVSSLIYDIGSFYFRVGYSGEDLPKCVIQPVNTV